MDHLVDTKIEDLKVGDIFYTVSWDGNLVGPYMFIVFSIKRATRKLPYGSFIGNCRYQADTTVGAYSLHLSTKGFGYHGANYTLFKVDPTAKILIESL